MSVQSNYFNYLFLIREMIEIASQSYQMYNSSTLLARPWINAFFMSLVVVNCWSTPILQHVLAHSSGLERVVCLTLDGLLDAGSAILIPLIVFLPYARVFDRDSLSFSSDNLYDPQWFVNMVRENRMLFAMSSQDLFSKLVPHHSLWSCMKNIKKLIVRQKYPSESNYAPGATDPPAKDDDHDLVTKKVDSSPKKQVEYPGKGKKLVHAVFTSWGIAVLVIYLHARHISVSTDVPACKLPLRPWFATTFACASYNFDCHEQGQVDTVTSSDLSILRNDSLAALIISNCPAVKMPPELRNFPNLLKFLLYNSTIASWDSTASLNSVDHTSLVSICLVRVNMTEFPLGLQQELPNPLTDIQVSTSNLTYLPSSLSQKWQPMTIMYFEFCDFTEFPLVLLDLRADDVSLAGAKITALPSNMSSAQFAWIGLVLSGNALLSELPDAGLKSGILTLSIENTNVSEIPSWVYSGMQSFAGGFVVYAYNTPFCLAENTTSSVASSGGSGATGASSAEETVSTGSGGSGTGPTGSAGGGMTSGTVNCVTRDPSGEARYPLALTTSSFQPS
uniref:Uncharacterized protein n=1 Tax=Globisporangium ultimum (strain ATCC 200006 / CBS 805.95 / DAOM BR144) TaxID=431595 RepID=K3WEG2_GLOUD